MTDYKLNQNVDEDFSFFLTIKGKEYEYKMRYPNAQWRKDTAEIGQKIQRTINKANAAQKAGDDAAFEAESDTVGKQSEEMSKLINSLVTPVTEGAPGIDKALEDQPTPVLRNFQNMLRQEISLEVPDQVTNS